MYFNNGRVGLIMSATYDRFGVLKERKEMDKLEYALEVISRCDLCNGRGNLYYSFGDEFDSEVCECNPYELILDDNGDVLWDNGLLSEPELAIFGSVEAN